MIDEKMTDEEMLALTLFTNCCSFLEQDHKYPVGVLGVRGLMMMELMMRNISDPQNLAVARKFFRMSCDLLRDMQEDLSPLLEKYWRNVMEEMDGRNEP